MNRSQQTTESKTILIVDDDHSICAFFETVLSAEGFRVITETSGEDALKLVQSDSFDQYDLLILDLMMPNYGGFELLREMQQEGYQKIPIFVVTARVLDQGTIDMIRMESNVQDFFKKPVDPKELRKRVHQLLGTTPTRR